MIQLHVPPEHRARAMGRYSMVLALGVALGQVLGGLLVAGNVLGLGWRLAFLADVPACAIVLTVAVRALPRTAPVQAASVDAGGIALLSLGLGMLLVPLTLGPDLGWPLWTWPCLATGLLALAGFPCFERWTAIRGGQPLVDPTVLRAPGVKAALTVILVSMATYASLQLVVSLHVQAGLHLGSLQAGLTFACYALGFGAVSLNWPRLPATAQRWMPIAGLGLLGAATLALALQANAGWSLALMLPVLPAAGCGHGAAYGPLVHLLAGRLRPEQVSTLSGLVPTTTQLAGVLGVVAMGGLYLRATAGGGSSAHGLALVAAALALAALPAAVKVGYGRGRD